MVLGGKFYSLKDIGHFDALWVSFWGFTKEQRKVVHVTWGMGVQRFIRYCEICEF